MYSNFHKTEIKLRYRGRICIRLNAHSYLVTLKVCNFLQNIQLATCHISYYSRRCYRADHENDLALGVDILEFQGHLSGESNVSISVYITFYILFIYYYILLYLYIIYILFIYYDSY